jgi:hypothetical protein
MTQSAVLERDEIDDIVVSAAPHHRSKTGRPSLYDPSYCQIAEKLCQNGATEQELADHFGTSLQSLKRWKLLQDDFRSATRLGKETVDDRVERSLLERALGSSWVEEQPITLREVRINLDTKERVESQRVELVRVQRSAPPDTNAAFIWLRNRRGKDWKDKMEVEHSGVVTLAALVQQSLEAIEARREGATIEGQAIELQPDESSFFE